MDEFRSIAAWMRAQPAMYLSPHPETLPSPGFISEGQTFTSFSSNNYLGLASHRRLVGRAREGLETFGVGNCESRLVGGNIELYSQLEQKLAALKKQEAAMTLATGYLTNLGVLSALCRSGQLARVYGYRTSKRYKYVYFTDELNHISIREGIRMSGADRVAYRHLDMDNLEAKIRASEANVKIIVSDGVFSQDGDIAPLPELVDLADRYDCTLYIDDAHGTGVLGRSGGGLVEHFDLYSDRIIHMGTMSKAYGSIGGFVSTIGDVIDGLRFSCSAYGFTCPIPPDQACAVLEAMDIVKNEPERRQRLWDNQRYFVQGMEALGYTLVSKTTPIVPVLIGEERESARLARTLRDEGLYVDVAQFPAVPMRKSRLRFMMNAEHTRRHLDDVLAVMARNR